MVETVFAVTFILYLALQIEDKFAVPSPLSLIALSFLLHRFFPEVTGFTPDARRFATLVLTLLPVLLISDSLGLRMDVLRRQAWSLFYLAVVTVILSVVAGVLVKDFLFSRYHLGTAATILLFAMVLATDPVSVVSVFSRFEIPHRLKVLAEGESLFNDATALIVFVYIGLHLLGGARLTPGYLVEITLAVGLGSVLVGLVVGLAGLALLKTTENRIAEMMVLIATGYGAFALAQHFYFLLDVLGMHSHLHLSGILACIVATVTVNHWMCREVGFEERRISAKQQALIEASVRKPVSRGLIGSLLDALRVTVEEQARHLRTQEDIQLLGLVANTILFVSMAEIVQLEMLVRYWREIVLMFLATTVIRALMMAKFVWLSRRTRYLAPVASHWWGVLTFAGIKGGLSIVMLSMIPDDFPFLDLFRAVVIGVVLASTFLYSLILLVVIGRHAATFRRERAAETKRPTVAG